MSVQTTEGQLTWRGAYVHAWKRFFTHLLFTNMYNALSYLGLRVTLSEPDASDSVHIILSDSPRNISLALGKTYNIMCEGEWYRDSVPVSSNAPDDGSSGVYVTTVTNEMVLHLQLFSEAETGHYVCRDDSDTEFILNITTGM